MARLGGHALDVAAEAHDEIVDGASGRVFVEIPDILQDGFARNGLAAIADQVAQQLCFHQCELEYLASASQLKVREINRPIVELEDVRRLCLCDGRLRLLASRASEPVL